MSDEEGCGIHVTYTKGKKNTVSEGSHIHGFPPHNPVLSFARGETFS